MKNLLLVIVLLLVSNASFSQKEIEETIFTLVSQGQTRTLSIDVNDYHKDAIGSFKDDLYTYPGKVEAISLDEASGLLIFTYNEFMLEEDLIKIFKNNGINYKVRGEWDVQ